MKKLIIVAFAWIITIAPSLAVLNVETVRENIDTEALQEKKEVVEEIVESKVETISEIVYENKDEVLEKISKFIVVLENLKQEVDSSSATAETKTSATQSLDQAIVLLQKIQTEIEQAESAEDVKKILTTNAQELKTLKEEIKNELLTLKMEIQNISTQQIEQAIAEIEQILRLIKIVCPAQTDAIMTIEENLTELEALLIEVNNAIKAEKYSEATDAILDANELIIETTLAVQEVSEGCLY